MKIEIRGYAWCWKRRAACCAALLVLILASRGVAAEGLTLGFPAFAKDLNLLDSSVPAAVFVQSAVGGVLVRREAARPGRPGYRLELADYFTSSSDFSRWSFRIRRGGSFSSGVEVKPGDVVASLKRCQERGQLKGAVQIRAEERPRAADSEESWVEIEVAAALPREDRTNFPKELSDCPIFDARAMTVFGGDCGNGTNLVSSGKYAVIEFYSGKQIRLQRISTMKQDRYLPTELTLRGFENGKDALTALRMATLDGFFSSDSQVLEKARQDSTLTVVGCLGMSLVKRKSLLLECNPELDLGGLRYGE